MGEIHDGQHAEDQRQADGEQDIDGTKRQPGEQLHGDQIESQAGQSAPPDKARPIPGAHSSLTGEVRT